MSEDDRPLIEQNHWYQAQEAADLLGVHLSTLRRWADAGKIPHKRSLGSQKRGGIRTFKGVDITVAWLEIHGYV